MQGGVMMENSNKVRVVVADDDTEIVDILTAMLRRRGYAVEVAYNGKEALVLICQNKPELIILDCNMPLMNGIEVFHAFRQIEELENIPVIFCSATHSHEVKKLLGPKVKYMKKPFFLNELYENVDSVIYS